MAEHITIHKYVIIKRIWNKKVVKLLVQRRKFPYRTYLEWIVDDPQPEILFKYPEWIKDFVDKLNRKEIKFLS